MQNFKKMIQRIQSIYLLLVSGLSAILLFSPLVNFSSSNGSYILKASALIESTSEEVKMTTLPLAILIGLFTMIAFVSIFLFKHRILQLRLNSFNIFIQLGYVGLLLFYVFSIKKDLDASFAFNLWAVFPVITAILSYLAIRAIGKDEALIRSVDRIR